MPGRKVQYRIALTMCLAALCAFIANSSKTADDQTTAYAQPVSADSYYLRDIYDLEDLFVYHQQSYLPMAPPAADFYLKQPYGPPVPFDRKGFPDILKKKLLVDWAYDKIPTYRIFIYEDPETRDTVFLNERWEEMYRLPALPTYAPAEWVLNRYPGIMQGAYSHDEMAWLMSVYDPMRIQGWFTLVPLEHYSEYLKLREKKPDDRKRLSMSEFAAYSTMRTRSMPYTSNDLWLSIRGPGQGYTNGAEIAIHLPVDFTNAVELYVTEDLILADWALEATNLTAVGTNVMVYEDHDATNKDYLVYMAVNAIDSDGDELIDGYESLILGTRPDDSDTDDDGRDDGAEVAMGLNPLNGDTDGDLISDGHLDPDGPGGIYLGPDPSPTNAAFKWMPSQIDFVTVSNRPNFRLLEDKWGRPIVSWVSRNEWGQGRVRVIKFFGAITNEQQQWADLDGLWEEYEHSLNEGLGLIDSVSTHDICVDTNGDPIVVWSEGVYGAYDIYVKAWDSFACSWKWIAESASNASLRAYDSAKSPVIVLNTSNHPVVAYIEYDYYTSFYISVKHWDGASWVAYGNSTNGSAFWGNDNWYDPVLTIDKLGRVVCGKQNWSVTSFCMKRWESPNWEEIGCPYDDAGKRYYNPLSIVLASNEVICATIIADDYSLTNALHVKHYTGSSTWGGLGDSASGRGVLDDNNLSRNPCLYSQYGGHVGIAWVQTDSWTQKDNLYLKYWTGSNWVAFGSSASGNNINTNNDKIINLSVSSERDTVCLAYSTEENQIRVKQYWSDVDEDGLSESQELIIYQTDPDNPDSDNDGLNDGWEVLYGFDPLSTNDPDPSLDSDGDGLDMLEEEDQNTSPFEVDTDHDGLVDGTNGVVSTNSYLLGLDADHDGFVDGENDPGYQTDPTDCDTDNDGLIDGIDGILPIDSYSEYVDANTNGYADGEYDYSTTSTVWDCDGDQFPDGWEVEYGYDPLSTNEPGVVDSDSDGLLADKEYAFGTSPRDADSDDDSISDGALDPDGANGILAGPDPNPTKAALGNIPSTLEIYAPVKKPAVVIQEDACGRPVIAWVSEGLSGHNTVHVMKFFGTATNATEYQMLNGLWEEYGTSYSEGLTARQGDCKTFDMILDSRESPIVAWEENNIIFLQRYCTSSNSWVSVGASLTSGLNPELLCDYPDLAVDSNDYPTVAFRGGYRRTYITHWNGAEWRSYGNSTNGSEFWGNDCYNPPVCDIDHQGRVICTKTKTYHHAVKRWTGAFWDDLPDVSGGDYTHGDADLAIDSNNLIHIGATYQSLSSPYYRLHVNVYSNGSWTGYGGSDEGAGLLIGTNEPSDVALFKQRDGLLGVAWTEPASAALPNGLYVKCWNKTNWSMQSGTDLTVGINTARDEVVQFDATGGHGVYSLAYVAAADKLRVMQWGIDSDSDGMSDQQETLIS